jgi:predicted transcriptional regulator
LVKGDVLIMMPPIVVSLKDKIGQVIELAPKETKSNKENILDEFISVSKGIAAYEKSLSDPRLNALESLLESFEQNDVLGILTVMYVGRDNTEEEIDNPDEFYKIKYSHFSMMSKEDAIDSITEKTPLKRYLENGLKLLKV